MLKHHADAPCARLLGVTDVHRLPVEYDRALVGLDGAIDDFHQRRFTRTVFTKHGVNLTRHHRQRHITAGDHARVTLGDAGKLQTGDGHGEVRK